MARPFPTTFDKDSPISAQSGGSTPISYQANVNRQKTKKWADAKPANYGGDDWGDDDEYEYDEPPPPVPKPTGLRQQGHTLQSPPQSSSPIVDNNKKNYGNLPGIPGEGNARARVNSFDAGDEKRNFSSSAAPPPSQYTAAGPATRFSQITGVPTVRNASGPPSLSISTQQEAQTAGTGQRQATQVVSPVVGSPHPSLQAGRVNTGESSTITSPLSDNRITSGDYQARRDYSPTAVPAPLATRSPAPQSATDSPATRFPARKSSLSQAVGPTMADITRSPQEAPAQKPWGAGRSSSPGPKTDASNATTAKALPFIRPADIYRRAEEERRQSLESGGRPSMDSIVGTRPGDRSDSPGRPPLREKLSSDSLGGRRRASLEGDDGPSSSRHLTPILEPVRERKSEYGFEGFNVRDHAPKDAPATGSIPSQTMSESTQLSVQETRRQSTSPKLPDLNRLSGFGMDIFSQSKPDDLHPLATQDKANTNTTAPQPPMSSPPNDDAQLPRQPSLGFRSVVNQAFDRGDDSSVPATPASQTDSNVRRTDSDSTGTGGISPIMSSGPGSIEARNRDISKPSILEVVEEQSSLPGNDNRQKQGVRSTDSSDAIAPGFKPGHRRDISTPSPGNSPARTPDIAKVEGFPHGQQAAVSDRSSDDLDGSKNDITPPRPGAASEQSFRPALPGAWTSYATTARTDTPQPEGTQTPESVARKQHDEDNDDLTPTTTKRSLPQSALGAVAGAAFGSGAAQGTQNGDSALSSPVVQSTEPGPSNDALPTPDLAMAPSGNLYSTTSVDPRLLPKLEHAPPETQLRPDIVNRSISSESSDAPPPPPKDTPVLESKEEKAGYFPSTTIPGNRSVDLDEETRSEGPALNQHNVSIVATDSRPNDYENDRLQEEIVRRLSPQPSEGPYDNNLLSAQDSSAARESTYLPTEYGDYWASTADDEPGRSLSNAKQKESHEPPHFEDSPATGTESLTRTESETIPIAPLIVHRSEQSPADATRPPLKQRFSWEQSSESVSIAPGQGQEEAPNVPVQSQAIPVHNQTHIHEISASNNVDNSPVIGETQPRTALYADEKIPMGPDSPSAARGSLDDHHISKDAAVSGGAALAAGATAAVTADSPKGQPERRQSLAEEKATRVSSYPVSATPPEDEHPARSQQPYFSPTTDQPAHPPPPSTVSPINSPVVPQFSPTTSRLLAFKEIAAMKSPHQRIQTFDETRQRFAAMDSGLTDWMATLRTQHPEHAGVTGSWAASGMGAGVGSAKSKLAKPAGAGAQPLQQPYYQQYLNASSPSSPSTPTTKPGPSAPAVYQQQGFSPAGPSKITSQQVQAKGKEFLHTAGVFGGKAGKAGKGLLAKGKNKLRGGGGDKTSPPPKPKNDRRSSWGLPLTLSKSTGRPDPSNRLSRETTPVPMPPAERQRAATMTSMQSIQPSQLPQASTGDPLGPLSNLPPTNTQAPRNNSPPSLPPINTQLQQNEPIATVREIRDADQSTTVSETRDQSERGDAVDDTLGVPAPIGKSQPSWDPLNATPIAEEQGSSYDTHPNQHSYPFPSGPAGQQPKLSTSSNEAPKIDPSNSEDVPQDAMEDQTDIKNDWVIVTPEAGPKEVTPKPESEDIKTEELPPPSIMHRPRGSSYDIPLLSPSTHIENSRSMAPSIPPSTAPVTQVPDAQVTAPVQQHQNDPRTEQEQGSDSSFLPPIRRTSTFGFGFGSRQAKQRFPIEDDDEQGTKPVLPDSDLSQREAEAGAVAVVTPLPRVDNHEARNGLPREAPQAHQQISEYSAKPHSEGPYQSQGQQPQSGPIRPMLMQATSSQYNQLSTAQQPIDGTYQPQGQQFQAGPQRPMLSQNSSEYSQRTMTPQRGPGPQSRAPRPDGFSPPPDHFRRSQDAWRPNVVAPPSQPSPPKQNVPISTVPRQSWEAQRPRGLSGSSQGFTQRPDGPYSDRIQWTPQQSKTFEQPPSSAQRYPELFRAEPPNLDTYDKETGDLPPHYYQPPIPREAAFLPRQQTNEYQLPGVGPPADEPRGSPRRNSAFFKEIGGRISRATSRERGMSISRDGDLPSPGRASESRGNEYAESSVTSEEGREQNNRRSNFFRGMSRVSTGALNPPHSRESMVAHHPGSRTDLLITPQPSPIATQERKRSFFGSSSAVPSPKSNKLSRASTSGMSDVSTGKKKRFSGLSGFFGKPSPTKSSVSDRPQATRELSYNERQPIESPQFDPRTPSRHQPSPQVHQNRPPQQVQNSETQSQGSRNVLSKLKTNVGPPEPPLQETRPRKTSKTRRASASGLLSGIMGRRSTQQDGNSEDSQSQGSQPQAPQYVPPARTYTDLQEQQSQMPSAPRPQPQMVPPQDRSMILQERGRQVVREPQYDSVPIPGGYSLVRGQGTNTMPTDYDPRGLRFQQVDPRFLPQGMQPQGPPQSQGRPQHQNQRLSQPSQSIAPSQGQNPNLKQSLPNLSPLDTYQIYQSHQAPRRLSREDLIARSPARSPEGQQRPYQLSLPEDDEDRDHPIDNNRSPISQTGGSGRTPLSNVLPPPKPQHDVLQRLQGPQRGAPQLRHPESPAGYPLPDDVVFSPVNPSADGMPPPPPPKDAQSKNNPQGQNPGLGHAHTVSQTSYLTSMDLNRSATHRTAVSAISGMSDPHHQGNSISGRGGGGLNVPNQKDAADGDRHVSSPSPTPPSPAGTPVRAESPEPNNRMKTTVLEAPRRPSLDLYDASPMIASVPKNGSSNGYAQTGTSNLKGEQGVESDAKKGNDKPFAELEGTKADGFNMKTGAQEEKIFYDAQSGMRGPQAGREGDDDGEVTMSATSYPGQEWNPYGMGYEDD